VLVVSAECSHGEARRAVPAKEICMESLDIMLSVGWPELSVGPVRECTDRGFSLRAHADDRYSLI
jgi:hypothetical protein